MPRVSEGQPTGVLSRWLVGCGLTTSSIKLSAPKEDTCSSLSTDGVPELISSPTSVALRLCEPRHCTSPSEPGALHTCQVFVPSYRLLCVTIQPQAP